MHVIDGDAEDPREHRRRPSRGISASAAASSSSRPTCIATARAPTSSIRTPAAGSSTLSSTGASKYWEIETTGRYLASEHKRPERLLRAIAQHARSQRLRSVLRQLQESDHQAERELAQPDRRPESHDRARHDRPAGQVGHSRRSTNGAPGSPGRRSTSSRTSSARATNPGGCRRCRTLDFSLVRPLEILASTDSRAASRSTTRSTRGSEPRRADEHHVARFRHVLQSNPAIDRIRRCGHAERKDNGSYFASGTSTTFT